MRVWGKIAASVVIGLLFWWFFATACFALLMTVAVDATAPNLDQFREALPALFFWGALMAIAFSWVGAPAFIGLVALVLVIPGIRAAKRRTHNSSEQDAGSDSASPK